jgi:hypothetical protein
MRYSVRLDLVRFVLPALFALSLCATESRAAQVTGELRQWHRVELIFTGPTHSESASNPNPFLDYRLQCLFIGPSGQTYNVPGFFDTNGSGGSSGNVWKCRFAPDQTGTWQYTASFRQGANVAAELGTNAGSPTSFDGDLGNFSVGASNKLGRDFRAPNHGTLVNLGSHYLQFAGSGERWIKGSADVPENFFGYTGFDNTPSAGHDFDQHIQDWNNGDPDWNNGSGKAIIGALNYLASTGANGFYFLPMNIGGDANDTFPTIGSQNKTHYDTSKLLQWETVFTHADKLGIFAHFQLAETESGNENYHDGGNLGNERKLYYRELSARFGHHLGIEWDLGEENDYGATKHRQFAAYIKDVDPYDHPVTTHIHTDQMNTFYAPLLGNDDFDMTAFQISEGGLANGGAVEEWRNRSAAAGRPLVISIDEPQTIENDPTDANNGYPNGREDFLWPIYMSGGGGFEWYVQQNGGGHSFDQQVDNWRLMSTGLTWNGHALAFMHSMPFWEMAPNKSLGSSTGGGTTYVLAKPGQVYALYNDNGGTFSLNLGGQSGQFSVTWFHPRNGTFHSGGIVTGGSNVSLGSAPFGDDAAVLVEKATQNCSGNGACGDGNPCTDDVCVSGFCQNLANSAGCNDGVACTTSDTCSGGSCSGVDGCPSTQTCNLGNGVCEGPAPCTNNASCNDSNPCTNDACVADVCQNAPNSASCDDGIGCTTNDVCGAGSCAGVDGCPSGQTCDLGSGICSSAPPPPTHLSFTPIEDAYVQGTAGINDDNLKVEPNNRTSYLKFDVNGLAGGVDRVRLILRENADPSSGITIDVHAANNNNWDEQSLSASTAPAAGPVVASHNGAVPAGSTLAFDLDPSAVPANGVYSFVVRSPSGNDVWFGSRESGLSPALEIDTVGRPPTTDLCADAIVVSLEDLTKTTKIKVQTKPDKGKVTLSGAFVQPAPGASEPDVEEVTFRVSDATGAYYEATIPVGAIERSSNERTFTFKDKAPYEFGLKQAKFGLKSDQVTTKFKAQAASLNLPGFEGTTSSVIVRIGNTCYVDPGDSCKVNGAGTRITCR